MLPRGDPSWPPRVRLYPRMAALLPRCLREAVRDGSCAVQCQHTYGVMAEFDIAVVGCGPSGAAVAWRLAGLGHRVALIGTGEKREAYLSAEGLLMPVCKNQAAVRPALFQNRAGNSGVN